MIWWCGPAAALGLAYWARHQWVQAEGMGVRCELAPLQWPCPARDLVIQAFIDHRLSTTATGLTVLAWGALVTVRWCQSHAALAIALLLKGAAKWVSWAGLLVSVVGLVLYDADRSALTALLCALAAVQLRAFEARSFPPGSSPS